MRQPLTSTMCGVMAYVSVSEGFPVPLPAELHYDVADPYAVRLSLGAGEARPVNWVFARSLLEEGLSRSTGTGDVLVSPGSRPDFLRIVLRPAAGAALVEMAVAEVAAFLRRTFLLVPPGEETLHVDLDRAVAELMIRDE
ncbi:SsgA family sporulation/cell division regulator [Streptomyces sp. NBC_01013]|uniref:SsgA family sporulation/cell division regulator n=1 Tax=Streptomyces sp. NBC_01013 TaxID=2903718 RepID=UPI00386507ED|nr:SsgA family sporulation/cell division regulator [Streptomyces sp. NBC_01013]